MNAEFPAIHMSELSPMVRMTFVRIRNEKSAQASSPRRRLRGPFGFTSTGRALDGKVTDHIGETPTDYTVFLNHPDLRWRTSNPDYKYS